MLNLDFVNYGLWLVEYMLKEASEIATWSGIGMGSNN